MSGKAVSVQYSSVRLHIRGAVVDAFVVHLSLSRVYSPPLRRRNHCNRYKSKVDTRFGQHFSAHRLPVVSVGSHSPQKEKALYCQSPTVPIVHVVSGLTSHQSLASLPSLASQLSLKMCFTSIPYQKN